MGDRDGLDGRRGAARGSKVGSSVCTVSRIPVRVDIIVCDIGDLELVPVHLELIQLSSRTH